MQSNLIHLNNGEKSWVTTKETLLQLPYFQSLFDSIQIVQIFIDLNSQDFDKILEYLRDSGCPEELELLDRDFDPSDLDMVEINIGNQIFITTKKTICKAMYFNAFFTKFNGQDKNKTDFIDRNPDNFKHILSYLRNSKYVLPDNLNHDLNFYGIDIPKPLKEYKKKEFDNVKEDVLHTIARGGGVYTTNHSEITFFKEVYRRYTHFAQTVSKLDIQNRDKNKIRFNVGNLNGDLLSKTFLYCPNSKFDKCNFINILPDKSEVIVETLDWDLIICLQKLLYPNDKKYIDQDLIPLYFFFTILNSYIPLLCLNDDLIFDVYYSGEEPQLYSNLILLENQERQQLTNSPQEMLIQLYSPIITFSFENTSEVTINLKKYEYVKYIIFIIEEDNELVDALIQGELMGNDKILKSIDPVKKMIYYRQANVGDIDLPIYLIPFCLKINEFQPSGELNMSTLDKVELKLKLNINKGVVKVWISYYNILRFMRGYMGTTIADPTN